MCNCDECLRLWRAYQVLRERQIRIWGSLDAEAHAAYDAWFDADAAHQDLPPEPGSIYS